MPKEVSRDRIEIDPRIMLGKPGAEGHGSLLI